MTTHDILDECIALLRGHDLIVNAAYVERSKFQIPNVPVAQDKPAGETPETDAFADLPCHPFTGLRRWVDFARRLERELALYKKKARDWNEEADRYLSQKDALFVKLEERDAEWRLAVHDACDKVSPTGPDDVARCVSVPIVRARQRAMEEAARICETTPVLISYITGERTIPSPHAESIANAIRAAIAAGGKG